MQLKDYILIILVVILALAAIIFIIKNPSSCGHNACKNCPNYRACRLRRKDHDAKK